MRATWVRAAGAVLAAGLLALSPDRGGAQEPPPTFLELPTLKIALEQAIKDAKRVSTDQPYFIIRKVALDLRGERRTAADGSVGFHIPVFGARAELGAKGGYTAQHRLKLELVPPESTVVGGENLIELVPLIRTLKDTFRAPQGGGGLVASAIEYTYKWTLQLAADGKVNVVVAKVGANIAEERSQEITFHLCQTLNRSDCI